MLVSAPEDPIPKNTSISLDDHFAGFVEQQVAEGRYGSVSEVARTGVRLLEGHEARLAVLRAALIEGEQSGPSAPFDFDRSLEQQTNPQPE